MFVKQGECCGVYGPGDFHFNGDNNGTGDTDELNRMWPLACCERETLSKTGHLKNCFNYVDHDEVLEKVNPEVGTFHIYCLLLLLELRTVITWPLYNNT